MGSNIYSKKPGNEVEMSRERKKSLLFSCCFQKDLIELINKDHIQVALILRGNFFP